MQEGTVARHPSAEATRSVSNSSAIHRPTLRRRTAIGVAMLLTLALTVGPLDDGAAAAPDGYQRFIVECSFSHSSATDPIVSPNAEASHQHEFFGSALTDRRPAYARMVRNRDTTCEHLGDTAAYWAPALRHRETGELVHATGLRAYYYSTEAMDDDPVVPFPRGFSFVTDHGSWMCKNTERLAAAPDCTGRLGSSADGVGLVFTFEAVCWDGTNAGRKANAPWHLFVTEQVDGDCPATHPVQLPWISEQIRYDVVDASDYEIVSMPARGLHADFWNTWQQGDLKDLVERCLQPGRRDCHVVTS
jgi:hypothetical protein